MDVRKKLSEVQNKEQFVEIIVKEEEKLNKKKIQIILQRKDIQKKLTKNEKLLIEKII